MNGRLANARAITNQILCDNFRSEEASDVISGANVEQVGLNVHVKFGDSRSNRSRDIRLPHFVRTTTTTKQSDLTKSSVTTNAATPISISRPRLVSLMNCSLLETCWNLFSQSPVLGPDLETLSKILLTTKMLMLLHASCQSLVNESEA